MTLTMTIKTGGVARIWKYRVGTGDLGPIFWGTEVPQRGPGADLRWGSGANPLKTDRPIHKQLCSADRRILQA